MQRPMGTSLELDPPARPPDAPMVWNGWGDPTRRRGLRARDVRALERLLGGPLPFTPPVELEKVALPAARLDEAALARLAAIVGDANVRTGRLPRVAHAAGRSYTDLVRLRRGDATTAPDAVVLPADHRETAAVLAVCADEGIAVVPFGGGTSVVGGVTPQERARPVVSLDLSRTAGLLDLDGASGLATFGAGTRGVDAEQRLAAEGLTLGHLPQSVEHATLGGFVATRSVGQASTGYGRIDDMVRAVRLASPAGEVRAGHPPASGAGPDLLRLLVGSEGTLGVITEVTVRVRPAPARRAFAGWWLPDFAAGQAALRSLARERAAPDVARLSDEAETRLALAQQSPSARGYVRARARARGGCLLVAGWDGDHADLVRRRLRARRALRRVGGRALGAAPGRAWADQRFEGPYQRDDLLDRGVLVETLETAAAWSALPNVYAAVRAALTRAFAQQRTRAHVMTHISHLYETGASLYVTVLARAEPGAEVGQWTAAKDAATRALLDAGGTVTHHHGVGALHRAWLGEEVGPLAVDALRAAKRALDPAGICNPGVLLPDDDASA